MDKKKMRVDLLGRRAAVPGRERKDAAVAEKILALSENYSSVFIYVSIGNEVSTRSIIEMLSKTHTVYVPYTVSGEMHAVKYDGQSSLSADKTGNIYESVNEFFDGQAELTVVPLLGFNGELYRIGYGKGCYDRYFSKHRSGLRVGLAYDEQLCEFVPESTDIPMNEIITPTKILRRTR